MAIIVCACCARVVRVVLDPDRPLCSYCRTGKHPPCRRPFAARQAKPRGKLSKQVEARGGDEFIAELAERARLNLSLLSKRRNDRA